MSVASPIRGAKLARFRRPCREVSSKCRAPGCLWLERTHTTEGTIQCFGDNYDGQRGHGDTTNSLVLVDVVGL
jgi:hypothetical protein